MNRNLILVNLFDINISKLSLLIAKKADLYYLNTEEFIDYYLMDKARMVDLCGVDYMNKEEKRVIKIINDYEKTIISMDYETFSKNLKSINKKANKIIYLQISEKQLEEEFNLLKKTTLKQDDKEILKLSNLERALLVFEERDRFVKKNCDFIVEYDISNIDKTANLVVEIINKR